MSLIARVRRRTVRTMPEGIARRRPSDAVRVVVAVLLLTALAFHADDPTAFERSFTRVFTSLPSDADTLVLIIYDLMALWAVVLLVVAVLLLRRWRLARDLLVAGCAAWVLGRLVGFFVRDTDLWHAFRVTFDLTDAPRYPLVRVGVAVAMVTVASPHLTRPTRRFGSGPRRRPRAHRHVPRACASDGPARGDPPRLGCRRGGALRVRHSRRPSHRGPGRGRARRSSGSRPTTSVSVPTNPSVGRCSSRTTTPDRSASPRSAGTRPMRS